MATPVNKPMDLAQATQRIAWLDEERRKDRAEMTRLAQELAGLLAVIRDQAIKLRETDDRLSATEQTLARIPRIEDTITLARSELIPLRDTDIRLEDEIRRQDKDRQAQSDQLSRLWSEVNARLDMLSRQVGSLSNRLQTLDTQRQDQAGRLTELGARLDSLVKATDALTSRIQLLEAREQENSSRHATMQAQLSRLEANQAQAMEEAKRSVSRVESLVADIQKIRREVEAAQEEDAKRRKEDIATLIGQKEAIASAQRQVEEISEGFRAAAARLDRLDQSAALAAETAHRLAGAEEQLGVLHATYKGLQEILDRYGGTEIPRILNMAEEAYASSQENRTVLQEVMAGQQSLKEEVRQLQGCLADEHSYCDGVAAALRGLMEEEAQTRIASAQKQLQHLRRLANPPTDRKISDA